MLVFPKILRTYEMNDPYTQTVQAISYLKEGKTSPEYWTTRKL